MNTKVITEDYVNFEIAKLLKEKGFDEKCVGFYSVDGKFFGESTYRNNWTPERSGSINASTIQMAMKWLREVHKICIVIQPYIMEDGICYCYEIKKLHSDMVEPIKNRAGYTVYEESVEAALKYALENLV